LRKLSIRVISIDERKVDKIFNLAMQLFIIKNKIALATNLSEVANTDLKKVLSELEEVLKMIYGEISRIRLIPLSTLFKKLEELAYSLANNLNKKIVVEVKGGNIMVDRKIVDALTDPLIHVVRNAIDHGIENPEERIRIRKKPAGLIRIEARRRGPYLRLEINDDGRGIDAKKVIEKAVKTGILPESKLSTYTWSDVVRALTTPGFSTKDKVTDISGRGVGLDVVKTKVEELGGRLVIQSEVGKGTRIVITIPLAASVTRCLVIEDGGFLFGIPLENVEHVLRQGKGLVRYSDKIIVSKPLISDNGNFTVILRAENGIIKAISVEGVLGEESLIIKPLPHILSDNNSKSFISGTALYHDGRIIYIIDPDGLN